MKSQIGWLIAELSADQRNEKKLRAKHRVKYQRELEMLKTQSFPVDVILKPKQAELAPERDLEFEKYLTEWYAIRGFRE